MAKQATAHAWVPRTLLPDPRCMQRRGQSAHDWDVEREIRLVQTQWPRIRSIGLAAFILTARSKQRQLHDQQASHGNLNKEHSITWPGLVQSKQRQARSPSISPNLRPGLKPNQPGRNLHPNHQPPVRRPPSAIMKLSGPIDGPVQGDDRQDATLAAARTQCEPPSADSICAAIQNPPPALQLYMAASLPCSAAPMTRRRRDPPCGKQEIDPPVRYGWPPHWSPAFSTRLGGLVLRRGERGTCRGPSVSSSRRRTDEGARRLLGGLHGETRRGWSPGRVESPWIDGRRGRLLNLETSRPR